MANSTATVSASKLNVRSSGSTSADLVGELPRGARVEVLARAGTWYEVRSGALHGFVHGDYLHFDQVPLAPGFLCHDDGLCGIAPAAPADKAIDLTKVPSSSRDVASAWNKYGNMLQPLCAATGIPPAAAVAVLCVESSGQAFANGRMIIRFENHIFWDQWGKTQPQAFNDHFTFDNTKRWTGHRYRANTTDPWQTGHTGQNAEWEALAIARGLNEPAALRSISMGAPQIMGFNCGAIGYDSAREMFDRFNADERFHILGLFDFIKGAGATSKMLEALRRGEYEQFATYYNGNGQAAIYGARIRGKVDAFGKATTQA